MKRRFALTASLMVALLIVGVVMVLTSRSTQAAAGVTAPAATSTLLLAENFDYGIATGNLTATSGGNWVNSSGASPYVGYTTTSLSMAGYGSSGVGGAATILTNGAEDVYQNFITQTNGTVYFAALVKASTAGAGAYFFHLKDATTGFRARVFGRNSGGALQFGLDITGTGVYASGTYSYNTTYLLVAKQNLDTGATALYVLDSFSASEPATPIVSFTTGTTVTVRGVAIRQASGGPSAIIDGVRVAKTWEDVVGVVPPPEADLGLSKDGPTTALAGENITYTLSVSNTGTYTATGTIITDTLPSAVTFVTYTTALPVNSFTQNGQDLIWNLGDVPTTTVNATIGVQTFVSPLLPSGASFTNTVTASTTYTEPNQANNTDTATTFIGAPDLAIVKTGPASANAGDTFTYTLAYSNAGSINATNVGIVDQLPTGVTFVTETTTSAIVANGRITWTVGALNAGNGGSIDVVVTANRAGNWVNTATISGGPVDSSLLNNTSNVTTTILGADPYVLKSGPTAAFIDRQALYTLTYGNHGNITATATLTDQLPVGFAVTDIAVDNSGLPFTNGAGLRAWTVDIAPNSAVSFTMALTVPTALSPATRITNTLTVSAIESGDNPLDNSASASSTVYEIVPISTARAGLNNDVFAVEGQVIYRPGTLGTNEWGLQDASGGISAFFSPAPVVQLNDRVQLVGTRSAFSGQPQLGSTVYYFANLGAGPQVTPLPYTTGQVAAGSSEGWLVVVTGTVSGLPACTPGTANYQFNLDDGSGSTVVFVDKDTQVNVCAQGVVNGARLIVTGFSTQFNGTMEIKPRFPADTKPLYDVTFIYNDLEDVVHVGEDVQLRGDFNSWAGITMTHNAGYTVFSATVTLPTTGTQNYKYYASAVSEPLAYDLLNTADRSVNVNQGVMVLQDYRNTPIGWGNLNGPASASINLGGNVAVSGQVYVRSVTDGAGAGRGVKAEMGYGTDANPANWTWSPMTYSTQTGNNDVYAGALTPTAGGVYSYALRYDANFGAGNPNSGWTYADLNGVPFSLDQAGVVTVTAPQLAFAKSVEKPASEMRPGDVVTYTIELSNSGDGPATGVLITDVLPVEVTFGGFVQQNSAAYASGTVTWGGSLNAGVTATVIFTATVGNQRAFYGRTVTNTAQFTSSNGGSDSAEAVFQIVKRYFIFTPLIRR